MIYFDNAATSFPKPPAVAEAMTAFMDQVGANPGRSGHRLSVAAARIVYSARESVARLFNLADPLRVVFTANATEAINLALRGILRPGDHILTSSLEHNSVMRPLRELEKGGVDVSVVPCSPGGILDPEDLAGAVRTETRMIVVTHASNVSGILLPVREVGRICRDRGILFLLDAAQTAGAVPIDLAGDGIDLLAFTGHKALFGPQGTGGLVFAPGVDARHFRPLKQGGTGSRSEQEIHPDFLPDMFEAGTPNSVGIAGLGAGVDFVLGETVEKIEKRLIQLSSRLREGLQSIPGYKPLSSTNLPGHTATVAFNIDGLSPSDVGLRLDEEYGILCRVGLHCAPAAHRTFGTFPEGAIRFGLGYFNGEEQIDRAVAALAEIVRNSRR